MAAAVKAKSTKLEENFDLQKMSAALLVNMARKAETAERYDDMCKFMKTLVMKQIQPAPSSPDLGVEERNLLSVAYKNVIGARRATWRTLNETFTVEEKAGEKGGKPSNKVELLKQYKAQVEGELRAICNEVLGLLTDRLLKATAGKQDESEVFYLKMAGDYYRYLVEFDTDKKNVKNAADNYEKALQIAKAHLAPTHPIRLGLALNYSVCFFEILNEPEKACQLAKQSFDDAVAKLDLLDETSYKDSTLIMQLLRDNLTLWTQPVPGAGAGGKDMNVEDVDADEAH